MDTPQLSDNALEPELSPLHNPILAENLDRWARVYVAAAPEFRSRAIQDLLRDLQAENVARVPPGEELNPPSAFQPVEIACPQCGKIKEPQQKFCGFCGAEFQKSAPNSDFTPSSSPNPSPSLKPVQSIPYASKELDSLRELSFSTIYGSEEPRHNGAKFAFVALVVLACLGTLGFLQWKAQVRATWQRLVGPATSSAPAQSNNTPAASPAPADSQSAPASPGPNLDNAATSQSTSSNAQDQGSSATDVKDAGSSASTVPASPEPGLAQANAGPTESDQVNSNQMNSDGSTHSARHATKSSVTAAAKLEPVKQAVPSAALLDNGAEELSVAQRYLNGASGARDPGMAATWLWKAVSKQNPTALVLLSELYARGEGVSRNCDQARLLLVAAAKKGAPDAGLKLRNFENGGCR